MTETVDHIAMENSPQLKPYYDNKRLFYWNAFWFLFGNAAAVFGQQTAQTLMPLHMARIKLDSQQISLVMSVSSFLGIPLFLYISHLTDHWQWKWGRRLPFLAMSFPFIILGLILFPYASTFTSCLVLYGVYFTFNNIKYSTYPYLINDISKKQYWGRMTGMSTVVACLGMWLGQYFLMPLVTTHGEKFIFILAALFVGTATVLTLLFVKEPPLRSDQPPQFNPVPAIWSVLRFGFSDSKRIITCIAFGLICASGLAFYYVPLQAKVNLGLDEGQIGRHILQYGTLSNLILAFVAGLIIDKLGTVKSMTIGYVLLLTGMLLGINPNWSANTINSITNMSSNPMNALATAYIFNFVGNNLVYGASIVFIMSSVHRKDVATFCACTGSVNLLIQSILMIISGWMVKFVFGGNYGFVFIISMTLVSLGIPIFFFLDFSSKKAIRHPIPTSEESKCLNSI